MWTGTNTSAMERSDSPGFRLLMNDERFAHIPKILETPKSDDLHEDVENMNVLKSLLRNN